MWYIFFEATMANNSTEPFVVSTGTLIASIAFKCVAMIVGILGNIAVIIFNIFLIAEKTPTSYLIANLAVADFLVCLTIYPIWIVEFIKTLLEVENDQNLFCKLTRSLSFVFLSTSIATLLAITIDRWLLFVKPLKHPIIVTRRRVVTVISVIWLSSLGLLISMIYYTRKEETQPRSFCFIPFYLALVRDILFIHLPTIFVIVINVKILMIARYQQNRIRQIGANIDHQSNEQELKKFKTSIRTLKGVKTSLIIVFVLVACSFMPTITGIVLEFGFRSRFMFTWYIMFHYELYGINSIVNAFIYGMRHPKYRKGYVFLLQKLCCGFAGHEATSN